MCQSCAVWPIFVNIAFSNNYWNYLVRFVQFVRFVRFVRYILCLCIKSIFLNISLNFLHIDCFNQFFELTYLNFVFSLVDGVYEWLWILFLLFQTNIKNNTLVWDFFICNYNKIVIDVFQEFLNFNMFVFVRIIFAKLLTTYFKPTFCCDLLRQC